MTAKRVLVVYAHPEPRSLNRALRDVAVRAALDAGFTVENSDLYAMNWKAVADGADFTSRDISERLHYGRASRHAYETGTQTADVATEQAKILRADALIFQFPLWWFSLPAILKGWIDRVFANGFAYGVGVYEGSRYGLRYGEGTLAGKRALVSVTAGGQPAHFSDRGVNGVLEDLLFPFTHGTLFHAGIDVLYPFAVHGANRLPEAEFEAAARGLRTRIANLFVEPPIPFRPQNGGDYDEALQLRPGLEADRKGLRIHRR